MTASLYPLVSLPSAPPADQSATSQIFYPSQFAIDTERLRLAATNSGPYVITHLLNSRAVKPTYSSGASYLQSQYLKILVKTVGVVALCVFMASIFFGGPLVLLISTAVFAYYPLMYVITALACGGALGLGALIIKKCVSYEKEMRLEEKKIARANKTSDYISFAHADAIDRARAKLDHHRALKNTQLQVAQPNGTYQLSSEDIKELYQQIKRFDDGKNPFYTALKRASTALSEGDSQIPAFFY